MSCGVGHRIGLDAASLWLWRRLAAAALIWLLAWDLPYATGAALKSKNKQTNKKPLKIELPYDLEIPILGRYPDEMKILI